MSDLPKRPTIEELRANKAKRDAAAVALVQKLEVEELLLDERLSAELGQRGNKYEIESTPEGVFAVKLGSPEHFRALEASQLQWEDKYKFVVDQLVDPTEEKLNVLMARRGLVVRLCDDLIRMHRAEVSIGLGKA